MFSKIESYKKSTELFYNYLENYQVPKKVLFERMSVKNCILLVFSRLMYLTRELIVTGPVEVPDIEIRDKSENALKIFYDYYKEQYEYVSPALSF
ncbi:hypothetical protein V7124_21850 [Neobacillus niacini]|uniref:hypothetical protein n=1 Tax=Neobacillus niacini TaxID=86668 RepID=UPI00300091C9